MKKIEKKDVNVTFTSDNSDEFFIELRKQKGERHSFIDFVTQNESIEVLIGQGNDCISMDLKDFEDLISESKAKLKEAKENWKKIIKENPDLE